MPYVKERISILPGSSVTRIDNGKSFISKKEFSTESMLYKLGFCYYKQGDSIFKVHQSQVKRARA